MPRVASCGVGARDKTMMITVNLLPPEFLPQEKKSIQPKYGLIIGGILAVVILVTGLLYIDFLLSSAKLKSLEKSWVTKQPEFQQLTVLRNEVEGPLKQEKDFMNRFVVTDKPLTNILMWFSELLPETVWLSEATLQRDEDVGKLLVRGIALPGQEQSSIEQIQRYLQLLKEKIPDATLSLTTSRQKFEGVEVTQFIANFIWGEE